MNGPKWKAELEQEGFVHLRQVFGVEDVDRLADLSLRSIDDYSDSEDLVRTREGVPLKLLYPLDKYGDFIALLGRREVREIVDTLLPRRESVLTWEDVLIKMPSVGAGVGPHQDIGLDPVRETVHSLGISLHPDEENPVFFLPGSHRFGPLTATAVSALWQECRDQFRPIITQPGDVVIHNVHVLHYSEPNRSRQPRATWYLEFRNMQDLLRKGPWNPDWTFLRRAIWVHARAAGGEDIGRDEPEAVRRYLELLGKERSSYRVPHITGTVRYDSASPYNHFNGWSDDWKTSRPATEGSHHLRDDGSPLYHSRYDEVLKFHDPGLASVRDASGSYHITPDGVPAYEARYLRTFGFYEGLAAVHSADGWFHILPDGSSMYSELYAWCGNFQGERCPVRLPDSGYFHITAEGAPAYEERYRYAGDFRDGFAVVQREDGMHSHIDSWGKLLHGKWFLDLDVFHKNHARARDERGWHHVDLQGEPLYDTRFGNVEPFYNGQARAEEFDGSLSVVDESAETVVELRKPLRSPLEELSADLVGLWKTQTIRAAVELGIFEALPTTEAELEQSLRLGDAAAPRMMRALTELGLVWRDGDEVHHLTDRGALLRRSHPLSLADAASHWGREAHEAWSEAAWSLRTGQSGFGKRYGKEFFDWLAVRPEELESYHRAMSAYGKHDYQHLADSVDFGVHGSILDAGGGGGELSFALLRAFPNLKATVMDRPEVVNLAEVPDELAGRCRFVPGDLFRKWPVAAEAVVMARMLHDWPDDEALRILVRAREAMPAGGALYVVEMVLDDSSGAGGLLDLNMLVMTGGAERTEAQFGDLLTRAGFELLDVVGTGAVSSVIRAKAL